MADLYLQRVLTRDQIIGLGHFQTVVRCNARLRRLAVHGYVSKLRYAARGSGSQTAWCLGRRGVPVVATDLDSNHSEVARVVNRPVSAAVLEHTLLLTEARVSFETVATLAHVTDSRWISEAHCRHEFIASGRRWTIKPDGYAEWRIASRIKRLFIELDLGNVSQSEFKSKCQSYVHYSASGVFKDVYGEPDFAVLVITTGPRRLDHLQSVAKCAGLLNIRFVIMRQPERSDSLRSLWRALLADGQDGGIQP